jgi:hypothetical protein
LPAILGSLQAIGCGRVKQGRHSGSKVEDVVTSQDTAGRFPTLLLPTIVGDAETIPNTVADLVAENVNAVTARLHLRGCDLRNAQGGP